MPVQLFEPLEASCAELAELTIPPARRAILQPLKDYVSKRLKDSNPINLNFICTHNSRRSHLAQLWMQALAWRSGFYQVRCFSGGTSATALAPPIVRTLTEQGFQFWTPSADVNENPLYWVTVGAEAPPLAAFSKVYHHAANPSQRFAALMTCAQADEECPLILGSEQRVALDYKDPKVADDTPGEARAYRERSRQIGSEMAWVISTL